MEKAEVKIIHNETFMNEFVSVFRAVVTKPVDEKYARKLVQDFLKDNTPFKGAWQTGKLYGHIEGEIDSRQDDYWIFSVTNYIARQVEPSLKTVLGHLSQEVPA